MPLSRRHIVAAVCLSALLVAACAGGDRAAVGSPGVTRSQHADTIVVLTRGDGAWGPVHDAVEVLRSGETSRETTFGRPRTLATTPDGGVLVFDTKAAEGMSIRQFGADGKFVRNIGRSVSGPGEYSVAELGAAVQHNGTILVMEPRGMVSRFSPEGRFVNGFRTGAPTGMEIAAASDSSIFIRNWARYRRDRGATVLVSATSIVRYDTTGRAVDSLLLDRDWLHVDGPPSPLRTLTARQEWYVVPDGRILIIRTDKVGFLIVDPRGGTPPLIGEFASAPIAYSREERKELEQLQAWVEAHDGLIEGGRHFTEEQKAVPIPRNKLPSKRFLRDADGRIWVELSTPSTRMEPHGVYSTNGQSFTGRYSETDNIYAAFRLDGTFLGEMRFPKGVHRVMFTGDFAWSFVNDDEGRPALVKYRISP